jgi:aryl-alcohol dehydrogenase-like predicted oxidoreductase
VTLIDTADAYGPHTNELLIRDHAHSRHHEHCPRAGKP